MAILLGAAKILQAHRDELCGGVKLIFQPSEENASGAKWMAAEHAADDVDALLGAHVWGTLDAPLIDVSAGNRMAGADLFSIDVNGVVPPTAVSRIWEWTRSPLAAPSSTIYSVRFQNERSAAPGGADHR